MDRAPEVLWRGAQILPLHFQMSLANIFGTDVAFSTIRNEKIDTLITLRLFADEAVLAVQPRAARRFQIVLRILTDHVYNI